LDTIDDHVWKETKHNWLAEHRHITRLDDDEFKRENFKKIDGFHYISKVGLNKYKMLKKV